jgi:hypothetical protein
MRILFGFLISLAFIAFNAVDAATIKQTMDGAMDVTITHPDSVIVGRDFSVTFFVQNNGWEDKQNIIFTLSSQDDSLSTINGTLQADRLSKGGSFGGTIDFSSDENSQLGIHYLNALYSQVFLSNNETPTSAMQKNIAIPIELKGKPEIQLNTNTPSSIFPNAEFPFDVEIISKDIDLRDVTVQINAPSDVTIRGQTTHTYSQIQQGTPLSIRTQIVTNPTEITSEHKIPFEVTVQYVDDTGETQTASKTVSLLLRPRTFMEFTTDGGIWIGGVFLAPYVSIGTLVGIPGGALFSLMISRLKKKKDTKKKKK